jgi:hypothetical protein
MNYQINPDSDAGGSFPMAHFLASGQAAARRAGAFSRTISQARDRAWFHERQSGSAGGDHRSSNLAARVQRSCEFKSGKPATKSGTASALNPEA